VARDKLIEELLDSIDERGFLRMGDVRDAIARNRLKLNDLTGFGEFWTGDPLLKLNKLLPFKLDGIYQRGEFYMRAFQRGSSLFFGTPKGRLFTKYVALPFGGAFLFLEGAQPLLGCHRYVRPIPGQQPQAETVADGAVKSISQLLPAQAHDGAHRPLPAGRGNLGYPAGRRALRIFLLALALGSAVPPRVGRFLKNLFWNWPRAVVESEPVQALLHNPVTRWMRRFLMVPVLTGALAALILRLLGTRPSTSAGFGPDHRGPQRCLLPNPRGAGNRKRGSTRSSNSACGGCHCG